MEKQPVSIRVLRMKGITKKIGLSESLIHDLVARGIFPKPFPLVPGGRAVGWIEEDVDAYINGQKTAGVTMCNSIILYHGRDDFLHIIDPENVSHFDELPPLLEIVIAFINAGFKGVKVDEKRMANGRYIQCLSVNLATPEEQIVQAIRSETTSNKALPSVATVIDQIQKMYSKQDSRHE